MLVSSCRIMGYEVKTLADSQALDEERTKTFIAESLRALVDQALSSHQSIVGQDLAALLISPADLLEVHLTRDRLSPDWDELDEGEIRQLDPDGLTQSLFNTTVRLLIMSSTYRFGSQKNSYPSN